MAKHIWEWDKKSEKPMMVVCVRCGQRKPLSKVLEVGCQGCPVEGVQEGLFGKSRENKSGDTSITAKRGESQLAGSLVKEG